MNTPLPDEVRVTKLADGVRFTLRRRYLSASGFHNAHLLALGLVLTGTTVCLFAPALRAHGFLLIFDIFVMLFGLLCMGAGLYCLLDFTIIQLRANKLSTRRRLGLLSWGSSMPADCLRTLRVAMAQVVPSANKIGRTDPYAQLATLMAECECAEPFALARSYPRDWLTAVADHLTPQLTLVATDPRAAAVAIAEHRPAPIPFCERPGQPQQSKAILEQHSTGLTLTVPPTGVLRGNAGCYFLFGLVWLVIHGIVAGICLAGAIDQGKIEWGLPALSLVLCLAGGAGVLLIGILLGKKRAVFAVVGATLMVLQEGLFGNKRHEWTRKHIADIRVGWSGPESVGGRRKPMSELQILLRNGQILGMLSGRDETELQWIATVLRRALRVPARRCARPPCDGSDR